VGCGSEVEQKPLYQMLAGRYGDGRPDRSVPVYAAGGYYYPGKNPSALKDEMRSYLDAGYTTVKMKIGGVTLAEDLARIEAVLTLLPSGEHLCVDANGRFALSAALAYARALEPYKLNRRFRGQDPGAKRRSGINRRTRYWHRAQFRSVCAV
jgi:L-alanine-DL-glutamate epimerase-like enolase superfamily enzyme